MLGNRQRNNQQNSNSTEELADFKLTLWKSSFIIIGLICLIVITIVLALMSTYYLKEHPEMVYWASTKVMEIFATSTLTQTPRPTHPNTFTPRPPTTTSTITPTPTMTQEPIWIIAMLPYFEMDVLYPETWKLAEVNRIIGMNNETCMDYQLTSPDGNYEILFYDICGGWDAFPEPCPLGIVQVGNYRDELIYRVPDPQTIGKYNYTIVELEEECMIPNPPSIWINYDDGLKAYFISFTVFGDQENIDFQLIDYIVLSFIMYP